MTFLKKHKNDILIVLAVLVLALVSYLIGFIRDKRTGDQQAKCLEIYENGVKYRGCNASFSADYANIIRVEYKNRIIVQTSWSRFKLHRFKDDKAACELLQKQLNRTK